jgi:hypothetical protein
MLKTEQSRRQIKSTEYDYNNTFSSILPCVWHNVGAEKIVIEASSEAAALKLKQKELTSLYVEYIKATKWDGQLPTTVLGNTTPMINLK